MLCCCGFAAKTARWASGQIAPNTEGPSRIPAISCPMTVGCPIRCIASPIRRPTRSSRTICARKSTSDGACIRVLAPGHRECRLEVPALLGADVLFGNPKSRRLSANRRLTYVDEGAPRQIVRRDLRHRTPPIDPGRRRRLLVASSPPSAAPAADPPTSSAPPERAPSAAAAPRTNPVASFPRARTESTSARSSKSRATDRHGASMILIEDACASVIHAGTKNVEPSCERRVRWRLPSWS